MKNIIIHEYEDIYKNEIIDLILEIQQREFRINIRKEDQPDLIDIRSFYQIGNGNFWVALNEGKVIGTLSLKDIGNYKGALRKMFVKAECRGRDAGVAQLLLETVLAWARNHRLTELYLGTTEKFLAAHRFYERNKFIQITQEELPKEFPLMKVDTRFYKFLL